MSPSEAHEQAEQCRRRAATETDEKLKSELLKRAAELDEKARADRQDDNMH